MIEMFYCLGYPVSVAVFNENRDVAFSFFTCKISGNSHLSGLVRVHFAYISATQYLKEEQNTMKSKY